MQMADTLHHMVHAFRACLCEVGVVSVIKIAWQVGVISKGATQEGEAEVMRVR